MTEGLAGVVIMGESSLRGGCLFRLGLETPLTAEAGSTAASAWAGVRSNVAERLSGCAKGGIVEAVVLPGLEPFPSPFLVNLPLESLFCLRAASVCDGKYSRESSDRSSVPSTEVSVWFQGRKRLVVLARPERRCSGSGEVSIT